MLEPSTWGPPCAEALARGNPRPAKVPVARDGAGYRPHTNPVPVTPGSAGCLRTE
jgi:hypothetical protein